MATAKKSRVCFTEEQWDFVERAIEEYKSSDEKISLKEICECVAEELKTHQMFKVDITGKRLQTNYHNRRASRKKQGKSRIVADPNDIRYILLVYGSSGVYKPTFHCDKLHLQRKVEEETTANGGIAPKMKIFTPVMFRVNIEEVREDGVL